MEERTTSTVLVNLACGHTAVFLKESVIRHGVPMNYYCGKCRKSRRTMLSAEEYLRLRSPEE